MTSNTPMPLIVAGAGTCGLVAALTARAAGLEVIVLERDAVPTGSTAMSQGMICAAGTQAQARAGIEDSPELFFQDIMTKSRGQTDAGLAQTLANNAGRAIDWLTQRWDIPLDIDISWGAPYGHSAPRLHGWPGRTGIDLIQLLTARASEAGVDLLTQARLIDIQTASDGSVAGITIERPDGAHEDIGCTTLLLATCGFGANRDMIARHIPAVAKARYFGHEGNQGEGIFLAHKLGAAVADMASFQGYGMLATPHNLTVLPHMLLDGGILVNTHGARFCHELLDVSGLIHDVLAQPDSIAWLVYDQGIEAMRKDIPEVKALIDVGAARHVPDRVALAALIGCNPDQLTATLDGAGRSFGRESANYTSLTQPFRAVKVTGALYHTQGGLVVDQHARVLRSDGQVIPGLYAGGGAARSVTGPAAWGYLPAMGLCTASTLGWLAANHVAATTATLR